MKNVIAFKVVKYLDDNGKIQDVIRGKIIIGCSDEKAVLIELAIIDKHYILKWIFITRF